jgi:hypothetical protein
MTANELADLLINADTLEVEEYFSEIATMLRQQQSEIEALKKELALQKLSDIGQEIEQGELQALVKSFFEDYLDVQEESDSGRVFNPIHISCVRAMKVGPLAKLLIRMRELSGAKE